MPRPPLWKQPALWSALAALALYLPTLGYQFTWDDFELIVRNPLLRGPVPSARLLLADFFAGNGMHTGFWRPLISLSYWLDMRLFHGAPAGFHAMNMAAHAAASALAALIVAEFGLAPLAALLAGLWFALLPAHVESVAFVSGRTDLYGSAFVLLALWLDRRARRAGRRWAGWGSLAALALALLSKESAVAFVPLVAIAEWVGIGGRRGRFAAALRWVAPAAALALVYIAAHAVVVPFSGVRAHLEAAEARQVAGALWLEFPGHLAFLWPWANHVPGALIQLPSGPFEPGVVAGVLAQVAFVVALVVLVARRSALAMPLALVWLPFLPLTWAGLAYGRILFAERFVYLPSAGVAWLLACGLDALMRPSPGARDAVAPAAWQARLGIGVAALLIAAGAWRSLSTLPLWKDDRAVFGTIVRERPDNPYGHAGWAHLLLDEGRLDEALEHARMAQRSTQEVVLASLVEAWVALYRGHFDEAMALSDHTLSLSPELSEAHLARGTALVEKGRYAEAAAELEPLARAHPEDVATQAEWGKCLLLMDRPAEALPFLERATQDRDLAGNPEFHYTLGSARARVGRVREARDDFAQAVRLNPEHYEAWLQLARASHELGDPVTRDAALARAAALPQASDGRAERLRREIAGRVPSVGSAR